MLTVFWSRHGLESKIIEHLEGEVIAEHSTANHIETLVEAGICGSDGVRELANQVGNDVLAAFPAPDGWFAHDEGGGAMVSGNGTCWESLEHEPEPEAMT